MEKQLTSEQSRALKVMEGGKNIFLTGYAGTGKTYVLEYFIQELLEAGKNVVVTAPTDIEAVHIEGAPLRRLLGIESGLMTFKKIKPEVFELLAETDTFVINAIELCSNKLFNIVTKVITKANALRTAQNKPQIQLVVSGDFCRIPYNPDWNNYIFQSTSWQKCNFVNIFLKKYVRPKNKSFAKAISKIQLGDASAIDYINEHSTDKKLRNDITLCSTEKEAKEINNVMLSKLKTPPVIFESIKYEDEELLNTSDYITNPTISLKKGAKIVFTSDDDKFGDFKKGDIKIVDEFIYLEDKPIGIKINQSESSPITVGFTLKPIYNYELHTVGITNATYIEKNAIGYLYELPFTLAYAAPVYANRGVLYNTVNINPIELNTVELYLALSHVCKISRLHFDETIGAILEINKPVQDFYKKLEASRRPRVPKGTAELLSQHKNDEKNTTSTKRGGRRKGSGRKKSVPGMKSSAIRVPEILADPLKDIKELDVDDVQEVAKLLNDFVRNHKDE